MPTKRANGVAPNPTIHDLQRQLTETRARIRELASERESLALPSLRGNQEALHRIAEIDQERTELVHRDETLNSAIRALQQEQREAEGPPWRKFLIRWRDIWAFEVCKEWGSITLSIEMMLRDRQQYTIAQMIEVVEDLTKVEQRTARKVVDDHLPPLTYEFGEDRSRSTKQQERDKLVTQITAELLDGAKVKRTTRLEKALTEVGKLIEGEKLHQARMVKDRQERQRKERAFQEWAEEHLHK